MSKGRGEKRTGGGLSIAGRFTLMMTFALAPVMGGAGFFLLRNSRTAMARANLEFLDETARLTVAEQNARRADDIALLGLVKDGRMPPESAVKNLRLAVWKTIKDLESGVKTDSGVRRQNVVFTTGPRASERGLLVQYQDAGNLIAPADLSRRSDANLFGLILFASVAVIAAGAVVALYVSAQVTKPLEQLGNDVRQISHGNLEHRTRVQGGGEVYHLARQIDRMAQSLEEAQENEIQLGVREREREVAGEVREALLPQQAPQVAGYTLADLHVDAAEPGGDFHDFIEADGRVIVLVSEVSGRGVPGALVGATARAYLRGELERGGDLAQALKNVNRRLARDVRRGMYVTSVLAEIQPGGDEVTLVCAGHKLPIVRYEAATKQVRLLQPEGIALGFDKGPVFDRSLEVAQVSLAPGDRLVLATTGPAQVTNPEGAELGEKGFYRLVLRAAAAPPPKMVAGMHKALANFAGEEGFPADVSLVVVAREA